MGTPIRVLIVEDSEDDATLICDELAQNEFEVNCTRVQTGEAMRSALEERAWDIIIADYSMPGFSGPDALRTLQETGLDIPFILVSGTASEDTGVEVMRAGARDFILKHNLSRLGPAVKRELHEAEVRHKQRQAEENVARLAAIVESSEDAIVGKDLQDIITNWNRGAEKIYGYTAEEAIGQPFDIIVPLDRQAESKELLNRVRQGESVAPFDTQRVRKDGMLVHISMSISPIRNRKGLVVGASTIGRDITEREMARERERQLEEQKRDFYRRTILAATDGRLVISEPEEIHERAGSMLASWQVEAADSFVNARNSIRQLALEEGMAEDRTNDFVSCAVEAMANVAKHVGHGTVSLHRWQEGLTVVVADKGPGIAALALPALALTKGYSTAASLGMGYKIMIAFADKLYLSTSPEGTVVAVQMKTESPADASDEVLEKLMGW